MNLEYLLLVLAVIEKFFTITAMAFGVLIFQQYRRQQRSNAAICARSIVQASFDDIKEIESRASLYENVGYYPDRMPEVASEEIKRQYPERPSRLITNRIYKFKYDFNEQIAYIGGKEAERLQELSRELQRNASAISSWSYAQRGKTPELAKISYSKIEEHREKIETLYCEILKQLEPIIEGRYWFAKWFKAKN